MNFNNRTKIYPLVTCIVTLLVKLFTLFTHSKLYTYQKQQAKKCVNDVTYSRSCVMLSGIYGLTFVP
jgi:hypothetical protein